MRRRKKLPLWLMLTPWGIGLLLFESLLITLSWLLGGVSSVVGRYSGRTVRAMRRRRGAHLPLP